MRKLIILLIILLVLLGITAAVQRYLPQIQQNTLSTLGEEKIKVVSEESVTIDIVKKQGPSVVTIAEEIPPTGRNRGNFDPFYFFYPQFEVPEGSDPTEPVGIGSGFILTGDGMIVTNKHVVSDPQGKYHVITSDDKKYTVNKIYRDPQNDVAIIQIDPGQNAGQKLTPIALGDSSKLQVGQYVVAIGTALGEFRNTVTTGVISGLGRGVTTGSPYEESERLDDVIQTDAAINPGNSGGPLLNSSGQVIGVNTAISESGQNIGFAIPINVIKDSLNTFNATGKFDRPYLGVSYRMISKDVALLNELPEGGFVQEVVLDSPAERAGILEGDIIVRFDGQRVSGNTLLSQLIAKKKVGDTVTIEVYRDTKTVQIKATLGSATEQ
jgi:serine protease Do